MLNREVPARLRAFAAAEGRNWKSKLRALWLSGRDTGALREARNLIGPSGLDRYDLKTEEIPESGL